MAELHLAGLHCGNFAVVDQLLEVDLLMSHSVAVVAKIIEQNPLHHAIKLKFLAVLFHLKRVPVARVASEDETELAAIKAIKSNLVSFRLVF